MISPAPESPAMASGGPNTPTHGGGAATLGRTSDSAQSRFFKPTHTIKYIPSDADEPRGLLNTLTRRKSQAVKEARRKSAYLEGVSAHLDGPSGAASTPASATATTPASATCAPGAASAAAAGPYAYKDLERTTLIHAPRDFVAAPGALQTSAAASPSVPHATGSPASAIAGMPMYSSPRTTTPQQSHYGGSTPSSKTADSGANGGTLARSNLTISRASRARNSVFGGLGLATTSGTNVADGKASAHGSDHGPHAGSTLRRRATSYHPTAGLLRHEEEPEHAGAAAVSGGQSRAPRIGFAQRQAQSAFAAAQAAAVINTYPEALPDTALKSDAKGVLTAHVGTSPVAGMADAATDGEKHRAAAASGGVQRIAIPHSPTHGPATAGTGTPAETPTFTMSTNHRANRMSMPVTKRRTVHGRPTTAGAVPQLGDLRDTTPPADELKPPSSPGACAPSQRPLAPARVSSGHSRSGSGSGNVSAATGEPPARNGPSLVRTAPSSSTAATPPSGAHPGSAVHDMPRPGSGVLTPPGEPSSGFRQDHGPSATPSPAAFRRAASGTSLSSLKSLKFLPFVGSGGNAVSSASLPGSASSTPGEPSGASVAASQLARMDLSLAKRAEMFQADEAKALRKHLSKMAKLQAKQARSSDPAKYEARARSAVDAFTTAAIKRRHTYLQGLESTRAAEAAERARLAEAVAAEVAARDAQARGECPVVAPENSRRNWLRLGLPEEGTSTGSRDRKRMTMTQDGTLSRYAGMVRSTEKLPTAAEEKAALAAAAQDASPAAASPSIAASLTPRGLAPSSTSSSPLGGGSPHAGHANEGNGTPGDASPETPYDDLEAYVESLNRPTLSRRFNSYAGIWKDQRRP
ncbi:hypothetical protein CXG81DRAFT_23197 [Caulochytrium protostelioides]|uniref:Uncharacterized protein n=1 Tax=Caulochytrium protostelioides TaxID=1555241 RepID=A0A4P9XF89_9FUNG|nr:hypothetical protein CXG81DRAFT_23197 [Caulochytrium protostelioides]|eukprot:RKP04245.1 hypothetical protein CXG81DRAFT_23197 [Caulochytrium protostelioides]